MCRTIRGIIFDFGGVVTRTEPRNRILRACESELGLPQGRLLELLFAGEHWWRVSTGRISEDEYWRSVVAGFGSHVPAELEPFHHDPFAYEPLNLRTISMMRSLRKHHTLALLSNATQSLESLLSRESLDSIFHVVVNSARVSLRKPDPRIFTLTMYRMGLSATDCLFVDDKERNTNAAETLGLQSILFRSAANLMRQLATLGVSVS